MSIFINNKKILGTEGSVGAGDLGLFAASDDLFYVKKSDGSCYPLGTFSFSGGGVTSSIFIDGANDSTYRIGSGTVSGTYSVLSGGGSNSITSYSSIISGGYSNNIESTIGYLASLSFATSSLSGTLSENNYIISNFVTDGAGECGIFVLLDESSIIIEGGQSYSIGDSINIPYTEFSGPISGTLSYTVTSVSDGMSNIAGGRYNEILSVGSFIGGGEHNSIIQGFGSIVGGAKNSIEESYSFIGGGIGNTVSGYIGTIAGGLNNAILPGSIVNTIGGGLRNIAEGSNSTIGGGQMNYASGDQSFIGGGIFNNATGKTSIIVGGSCNNVSGRESVIVGGKCNSTCGCYSVIGGGDTNQANADFSSILGGCGNRINGMTGSSIIGIGITASAPCTLHVNCLSVMDIPGSSASLPAGMLYHNGDGIVRVKI